MPSATGCTAPERMRPPRLAEPAQDRGVVRFEKHQLDAADP